MKEINGTITLAFVEEDNRQRVIFRVIPLCTREGGTFHGGAEEFPDEGSLRIVPDKREQSTFKERMREIGGLCVVTLASEGKELMKVRQNRNYAPDQGEKNRFAIYSDVICEFAPGGCMEVVEAGSSADNALTEKVLIHKDKMLYGPVEKAAAAGAELASLKPFGNERYLLHTIEAPQINGRHQICWDPEATINWRQRRNSLRKRERSPEEKEAVQQPKAEEDSREKAEAARVEKLKKMDPHSRRVERSAEILRQQEEEKKLAAKQEKAAARRQEKEKARAAKPEPKPVEKPVEAPATQEKEAEALPIGTHLEILDSALPFEQQISRLAQPLSEGANRLSSDASAAVEEEIPETVTSHFSGTPLNRNGGKPIRSKTRPENVHHVVEQQLSGQRDEVMGSALGSNAYGMVLNPIENLRSCVEYVWQNADMREQALHMLMGNEAFAADMADALRRGGMKLQASAAAQEQLAEIEADRLDLLMQLETARENNRKCREEIIANAAQKKRDEIERLKNEVKNLEATRKKLAEAAKALSGDNAQRTTDFLCKQLTCMSGAAENRVMISPVIGHEYTRKELVEQLRVHMNASGYSISEDEATSLLIGFALFDSICLCGRTVQDAQHYASIMLESCGLQSVSAVVNPDAYVEMVSLLDENTDRTPTVTMQLLGTETMTIYGHKTIYLASESMLGTMADSMLPMPVIRVPSMLRRAFGQSEEWKPVQPASLSAFSKIRADSHSMLSEAEKWFGELKNALKQENIQVSDTVLASMQRFMEVASRKVRGGFLTAADMAVCHWIVPLLLWKHCETRQMSGVVAGLPRAMEQLGIR